VDPYLAVEIEDQVLRSPQYDPTLSVVENLNGMLTEEACVSPGGKWQEDGEEQELRRKEGGGALAVHVGSTKKKSLICVF
jgi:hypothetical protein